MRNRAKPPRSVGDDAGVASGRLARHGVGEVDPKQPRSRDRWVLVGGGLLILVFSVAAFILHGNLVLPFYHNADADVVYAGQTMVLLNDGDLFCSLHPGGTAYAIYGSAYRALAAVESSHAALLNLDAVRSWTDATSVMTTAVLTGRWVSLGVTAMLALVLLVLVERLAGNAVVAAAMVLLFVTMPATLRHMDSIRPESMSVLFVLIGGLLIVRLSQGRDTLRRIIATSVAIGFCFGLAVLAKAQAVPLVAAGTVTLVVLVGVRRVGEAPEPDDDGAVANLALATLLFALMPWWTLRRPAFWNLERLREMGSDFRQVYGRLPSSFTREACTGLAALIALAVAVYWLRCRSGRRLVRAVAVASTSLTSLAIGVVVATYVVLVPVSKSFSGYTHNTNYLVYSTMSILRNGAFLENPNAPLAEVLKSIGAMHERYSPVVGLSVLYWAGAACLIACWGATRNLGRRRSLYLGVLALVATGFAMDVLGTLRWKHLYPRYAIYSVPFYLLGIALLARLGLSLSLRNTWSRHLRLNGFRLVGAVALVQFAFGAAPNALQWRHRPPSSGDPQQAWLYVDMLVPEFAGYADFGGLSNHRVFSWPKHDAGFDEIRNRFAGVSGAWRFSPRDTWRAEDIAGRAAWSDAVPGHAMEFLQFGPTAGDVVVRNSDARQAEMRDVTAALWFRVLALPCCGPRGETVLFGSADLRVALTVFSDGSYSRSIFGYYGGGNHSVAGPPRLEPGIWYHATLTKKETALGLYLDGVLVGTAQGIPASLGAPPLIGFNVPRPAGEDVRTAIFEVASAVMWSRSLSSSEVAALYESQRGDEFVSKADFPGGIREWWRLCGIAIR